MKHSFLFFLAALFISLVSCSNDDTEYIEIHHLPHKSENLATNESHYPDAPVSPRMASSLARSASLIIIRKFLRLSAIFFASRAFARSAAVFINQTEARNTSGYLSAIFKRRLAVAGTLRRPCSQLRKVPIFTPKNSANSTCDKFSFSRIYLGSGNSKTSDGCFSPRLIAIASFMEATSSLKSSFFIVRVPLLTLQALSIPRLSDLFFDSFCKPSQDRLWSLSQCKSI